MLLVEGMRVQRIGLPEAKAEYWPEEKHEAVHVPGRRLKTVPKAIARTTSHAAGGAPPAPNRSFLVRSWKDVDRYLERAAWLEASYARRAVRDGSRYHAANRLMINKYILQDGYPPGWFVHKTGFVRKGGPKLRALPLIGEWLRRRDRVADIRHHLKWKRGTNHGLPDASKTDESLLTHILEGMSIRDRSDAERRWRRMQEIFGQQWDDALPPALQGSRTGFKTKEGEIIRITPEGPRVVGVHRSLFPARRMINMFSQWLSSTRLRHLATRAKEALRTDTSFGHFAALDVHTNLWRKIGRVRQHVGSVKLVADDISAFDLSVYQEHQIGLADHVYPHFFKRDAVDPDLYLATTEVGIVSPPLHAGDAAFVYDRAGTTLSGIITTTVDGTIINFARVVECVAAGLGVTVKKAWELRGTHWDFMIWGDDTILIVPQRFSMAKYNATSVELGYECKAEAAAVFLMRVHEDPLRVHNLGSRVYMQGTFPEHPTKDPFVTAVAMLARDILAQGADDLGEVEAAILEGNDYAAEMGWTSMRAVHAYVEGIAVTMKPSDHRWSQLQELAMSWAGGEDDWRDSPMAQYILRALGLYDALARHAPDRIMVWSDDIKPLPESERDERWARLAAQHHEVLNPEEEFHHGSERWEQVPA